jgi:hypothetical protein
VSERIKNFDSKAETVAPDEHLEFSPHVYDWGRCIFCNVNDLDDDIYGPFKCIEREPYVYTTETPNPGSLVQPEEETQL